MSETELSEATLRKIASQKVTFRYSVKIHAICYGIINIILGIINITVSIEYLWVVYPIFGWLIGLMIHYIQYLMWSRGVHYGKRAIIIHLTILLFTMLLLLVINFMTTGTLNWVMYPAISWSLGFLAHILIQYFIGSKRTTQTEKLSKKERAIKKEMQKIRRKWKSEEGSK